MSPQPYMRLVCTSTRSAGAIGLACSTAMTCRACRAPTTNSKATSVIPVAPCCGPRANKASPSAHCNAKARGNSSRAPQQRASYWRPCATLHLRTWRRNDSALLRIANGSACSVDLPNRPECHSSNYVRGGRHYSLQAQGDFRAIAKNVSFSCSVVCWCCAEGKEETPPVWVFVGFVHRIGALRVDLSLCRRGDSTAGILAYAPLSRTYCLVCGCGS